MPVSSQSPLPVTFSSFVVSLAHSAMMHLGQAPHPGTGQTHANLPLAINTIDLLRLLRQKTTGNLDAEEEKLLNTLVEELGRKAEGLSK
jgi:hypothetical protein